MCLLLSDQRSKIKNCQAMSEHHTNSKNTSGDNPTTNFWVTLPGIITAIGGLIGALTDSIVLQ
jgi:hypothetical protein